MYSLKCKSLSKCGQITASVEGYAGGNENNRYALQAEYMITARDWNTGLSNKHWTYNSGSERC
jgi:hypothetical protein